MRLLRVELEGEYKSLKDQTFDFSESTGTMIVFAGLNGSGKSHLLELIVESFSYCERFYRTDFKNRTCLPFRVLLSYIIDDPLYSSLKYNYVLRIEDDGIILGKIKSSDSEIWESVDRKQIILPSLIGYSSGLNENLQRPFLKNDLQYYEVMSTRARYQKRLDNEVDLEKKTQINNYYMNRFPGVFKQHSSHSFSEDYGLASESVTKTPYGKFIDYDSNGLLLASLAVLSESEISEILQVIGIDKLSKIIIEYDLRNVPFTIDNVKDILQLIEISSEEIVGLSKMTTDEEYNMYELDFLSARIIIDLNDPYTKEKIQDKYINEPLTLFNKLYKLQLLGIKNWKANDKKNLWRDNFLGNIKRPLRTKLPVMVENIQMMKSDSCIDYHDLSDGEAQLLLALSTVKIFSDERTLFIFDEPETHLNPSWRTYFHDYISLAVGARSDENPFFQMIVSTHSPFIISALKKENVYEFKNINNRVEMNPSDSNTYGASFDVLIKQFFGLKTLISQAVVKEIKQVLETMEHEEKIQWIEENLGESMEKSYLLGKLKNNASTD